ncbi:hypothetical protein N9L23_06315, partial [Alphaproteobacteria bacterium]|nr:hypothetical protein [Alphaproteobacteria bacterium]
NIKMGRPNMRSPLPSRKSLMALLFIPTILTIFLGWLAMQFNQKKIVWDIQIPTSSFEQQISQLNLWGDDVFNIKPTEVADMFLLSLQQEIIKRGLSSGIKKLNSELNPGHQITLYGPLDYDLGEVKQIINAADNVIKARLYNKFKKKLTLDLDREFLHLNISREAAIDTKQMDHSIQKKKIELLTKQKEQSGDLPIELQQTLLDLRALNELGLTQMEVDFKKRERWKNHERKLAYDKTFSLLDNWIENTQPIYSNLEQINWQISKRFEPAGVALAVWLVTFFLVILCWLVKFALQKPVSTE